MRVAVVTSDDARKHQRSLFERDIQSRRLIRAHINCVTRGLIAESGNKDVVMPGRQPTQRERSAFVGDRDAWRYFDRDPSAEHGSVGADHSTMHVTEALPERQTRHGENGEAD
jgi:hypothetical protein